MMGNLSREEERQWGELTLGADPRSVLSLKSMGDTLRDKGKYREAEACLRKAAEVAELQRVQSDVQCSVWISLGRTLTEAKTYGEAERWLRRAVEVAESEQLHTLTRISAHDALAQALASIGKAEESDRLEEIARSLMSNLTARSLKGRTSAPSELAEPDTKESCVVRGESDYDVRRMAQSSETATYAAALGGDITTVTPQCSNVVEWSEPLDLQDSETMTASRVFNTDAWQKLLERETEVGFRFCDTERGPELHVRLYGGLSLASDVHCRGRLLKPDKPGEWMKHERGALRFRIGSDQMVGTILEIAYSLPDAYELEVKVPVRVRAGQ